VGWQRRAFGGSLEFTGKLVLKPSIVIPGGLETAGDIFSVRALGLAVTNGGGVLYHWVPGQQEPYMASYPFNRNGQPTGLAGRCGTNQITECEERRCGEPVTARRADCILVVLSLWLGRTCASGSRHRM